ncbi:leucine-rich repeat-containing protein 71 isoform X4 [Zootoca vivipara]|uniref:leucine-rich repeat-containing protein 71 isoform X4 n=1 Tax=Zootoca vivipara TaxID=8524 RepID=UPI001590719D|nr:leucine-rich repeat-containing protein 71 isoform X1 [Zootoca vivipara]XP_034954246.1 leucine-rich repeat-containing protein 71 isoform X4 [Zootoca vivipara]
MGKKGERGARDKAAALEEEARNAARRAEHGEEEYQCTGILEQDFLELCTRAGFQEIPKVTLRPHPNSFAVQEEPDPLAEREWPYIIAQIQCKYAFFRPTIQVDLEHEDPKTTKEIFIRNWKIEDKMLGIFAKCLPTLSHLQAIRLWKVGLTDVTFLSLLSIVPTCSTLKTLAVEGNPMRERLYHKLISEETNLAHVSLRSNEIDDEAALLIGQALSTLKSSNKNLASINLSYNHITDVGAGYIANGLRLNRSLLSLSLAHNQIKDEGALKLAEVLGPFALTHMEVVERRRLLLEKEGQERSRLSQRHAELRSERPSSHMSNTTLDKLQTAKTTKGTVKKKEKEKEKEEEKKEKKEKELPKKDDKGQASAATAATATTAAQSKKEDSKQAKKAAPPADQKAARGKGAKSGTKDKKAQVIEVEVIEPTEMVNPLLEPAEHRDGQVFLPGNRVLIYLNLIRNQITEKGLQAFLVALEHQNVRVAPGGKGPMGLMRLSLAKNNYPVDSKTYARIQELMWTRDPVPRSGARVAEEEF